MGRVKEEGEAIKAMLRAANTVTLRLPKDLITFSKAFRAMESEDELMRSLPQARAMVHELKVTYLPNKLRALREDLVRMDVATSAKRDALKWVDRAERMLMSGQMITCCRRLVEVRKNITRWRNGES